MQPQSPASPATAATAETPQSVDIDGNVHIKRLPTYFMERNANYHPEDEDDDDDEVGDGNGSDEDDPECLAFNSAYKKRKKHLNECEMLDELPSDEDEYHTDDDNPTLQLPSSGGAARSSLGPDGYDVERHFNPYNVKYHTVPPDWKPANRKDEKEPPFDQVDNPGNWPEFCFKPHYKTKGKGKNIKYEYTHHALPSGAQPVPVDPATNKRTQGGYEFFYNGEFNAEDFKGECGFKYPFRHGADPHCMFPDDRAGKLDAFMLELMGLTKERMEGKDALFFLNLLLPLVDPKTSGVMGDQRLPFFTQVVQWSNMYALQIGLGGPMKHKYKLLELYEIVRYFGVVLRDGALGGSHGDIHRRWREGPAQDDDICMSIYHSRWLQIKRVIKLCDNNFAKKRGEPGYDPAYKFDYIWKCLCHNTNFNTDKAPLDLSADETSYATGAMGPKFAGMIVVLHNKKVSKGGQAVVAIDHCGCRIRAYCHRHKMHPKFDEEGWTAEGPCEARRICEQIKNGDHCIKRREYVYERDQFGKHVKDKNDNYKLAYDLDKDGNPVKEPNGRYSIKTEEKNIYSELPHICFDNYFSGDKLLNWLGVEGFAATLTTRRDRLPKEIDGKYLHKERTGTAPVTKVARFLQPIVAVKPVKKVDPNPETGEGGKPGYLLTHVSFQSTGSTNIAGVNNIQRCKSYVRKRERGRGKDKRRWGIEMNEGRQLYLAKYHAVDTTDHYADICDMFYISWKYWHSPMILAFALAVIGAFDMYKEVAFGKLREEWKVEKPMSFYEFCIRLSEQMLRYDPTQKQYKGKEFQRCNTQPSMKQRKRKEPPKEVVDREDLQQAKKGGINSRLCGDLNKFIHHAESFEPCKQRICAYCGEMGAITKCESCSTPENPIFLHSLTHRKNSKPCCYKWHNDHSFGLAKTDIKDCLNKKMKDFKTPTKTAEKKNATHIRSLKK